MFDPRPSPSILQPVGAHALTEELRAAASLDLKRSVAEAARLTGTSAAAFVREAVAEKVERVGAGLLVQGASRVVR